jgi:hypothetical protein
MLGEKPAGDHHADAVGHTLGDLQDVRRHEFGCDLPHDVR